MLHTMLKPGPPPKPRKLLSLRADLELENFLPEDEAWASVVGAILVLCPDLPEESQPHAPRGSRLALF